MFKSFKFWMSIGLILVLIACFITDGFGLNIDVDYVTAIISVALSVMIMLGVIDRDLPTKTDAKDIQNELSNAKEDLTSLKELDNKKK